MEQPEHARLFLRLCAVACWGLGALFLLGYLGLAWILKDGLGPDSVESHGMLALGRFFRTVTHAGFLGVAGMPLLFGLPLFVLGGFFWYGSARPADRQRGIRKPPSGGYFDATT